MRVIHEARLLLFTADMQALKLRVSLRGKVLLAGSLYAHHGLTYVLWLPLLCVTAAAEACAAAGYQCVLAEVAPARHQAVPERN